MRMRSFLPAAAWTSLTVAGFGAGAAIAFVTQSQSQPAEAMKALSRAGLGIGHCIVAVAAAMSQPDDAMKAYQSAEPPLWSDLGSLTYPISTKSKEAQSFFDQGLRLSTNFNHAEARRAFQKAQRLDPSCAMCFLAEALILGPNINVPMDPEANAPAIAAL